MIGQMNRLIRFAALAAVSVLLLSGCQTARQRSACPVANILASASQMTAFKPGMEGDPAGELYAVQIAGVEYNCDFDKDEGTEDMSLVITLRATRAPTGEESTRTVPYFVAVMRDGTTIINKQILATKFTFAPGEASLTFTETVPSTVIKLDNGKKPYDYSLLTGLQLTREQLDYNGRPTP